jgi:predicted dehydrogenase
MTASRKRFIQVGCGGFGLHWLKTFLPRLIDDLKVATAVAAVDIDPATFPAAQSQLHLPQEKCYADAAKAFAENEADFVIIVVPPQFHESIVDLAIRHGLDILSEKPLADSMGACNRIYRKVTSAGRKMAVTMSHRFDQDKQSLQTLVQSGEHGPVHYIVQRFTHNCRAFGSWGEFRHRIADPLLIEGAVHHFDILRALAGSDAATVYALSWNPPWGEYAGDSTALVTIEMTNGVRCLYEGAKANASTLNGWYFDYVRAECRDATLELDRRKLRAISGPAWEFPVAQELPLLTRPTWGNAWLAEQFVDWLSGGPEPPNSIRDNIQCCALLFAAIESAHTKAPVDVQAFLRRHLDADSRD